jgi:rhamnosyl/mannosyltransferase
MKILHLGKFYPPFHGGMESYLRDLAEQQSKHHQVSVLVHNHQFNFLTSKTVTEKSEGIEVIRQKSIKPILFTPIMLGLNRVINKKIDGSNIEIIHISWPNPSALLLLLNSKAKKIPWVIQWQSDMVTEKSSWLLKLAYRFFKPLEQMLINKSSVVVASSKEYLDHSPALKEHTNKCHIIPLGIKSANVSLSSKDIEWANKLWGNARKKIFNIGRLTFYKNQQLLIQAAIKAPETTFIIAGTGQLERHLLQKINSQDLSNIILVGSVSRDKINALFKTCDAFCLPSNDRAESYGMVLLEALQFNKPILVSNLIGSGMKWIASQTSLGQTFDCNDAKDLNLKISNLNNMAIPKKVNLPQFSIESCQHEMDLIYHQIIN